MKIFSRFLRNIINRQKDQTEVYYSILNLRNFATIYSVGKLCLSARQQSFQLTSGEASYFWIESREMFIYCVIEEKYRELYYSIAMP